MPTPPAIRRLRRLWSKGIGLPGDITKIRALAQRLATSVDAPVLGGVAVILYGYPRTTTDLDLYTLDRDATYAQLEAAGAKWRPAKREHVGDDVSIHTVTPEDAGHVVARTCVIDGVRLVSLEDLIAIKLRCGLGDLARMKHLGDVQELIRRMPLDKRFAGKLPPDLRSDFKRLVDGVRAGERAGLNKRPF